MTIREYPHGFLLSHTNSPQFDHPSLIHSFHIGDFTLQVAPEVPVTVTKYKTGSAYLLGHLLIAGKSLDSTFSSLELLTQSIDEAMQEFHQLLDFSVGRWALFLFDDDGSVRTYNDVFALSQVFIHKATSTFGSHVNLIRELLNKAGHSLQPLEEASQYFTWFSTEDISIQALPPNFLYNSGSMGFKRYYPHRKNRFDKSSIGFKMDLATEIVKESSKWIASLGDVTCALTSGYDSRLCAAAILDSKADATFVTYGTEATEVEHLDTTLLSYAQDVSVAKEISRNERLNHVVLPLETLKDYPLSAEQLRILDQNGPLKHARAFQGMYEHYFGEKNTIMLTGIGLETWIDYYTTSLTPMPVKNDWARVFHSVSGANLTDIHSFDSSCAEWWSQTGFTEVYNFGFNPSSMVFWEIRAGRFQSEAIACQTTAFLPMSPLACRTIIEIGFSFSFWERKSHSFHRRLISELKPSLLAYPFNADFTIQEESESFLSAPLNTQKQIEMTPPPLRVFQDTSSRDHEQIHLTVPNALILPQVKLEKGTRCYFEHFYSISHGSLLLEIQIPYTLRRATKAVVFFVEVNGKKKLVDDIGYSPEPTSIQIDSLQLGDRIEFGVETLVQLGKSWINPSRLILHRFSEVKSWYSDAPVVASSSITAELVKD